MKFQRAIASCSLFLAAISHAEAQELLVVDNTNNRIVLLDGFDGTILNPSFIDLTAGTGSAPGTVIQAISNGAGEIWITDQSADIVHRWSADGTTYLGEFAQGADNIRGIHVDFNRIWICNFGSGGMGFGFALLEYDLSMNFIMAHPMPGSPFGVITHNGELLVSDTSNDDLVRVDPATGAVVGVLHDSDGVNGVDFPGQLSKTNAGTIWTAGLVTPEGIFEYDANGAQLQYIDTTVTTATPQGVHELGNGDVLIGAGNGLWRYDPNAATVTAVIPGIDANYITAVGAACLCPNFCMANANSTGQAARMSALGSSSVAANDLTLRCLQMPNNAFGFFLTSTMQGFVANPGGSQGNLCLAGSIGRYVGPGQVQNSGTTGAIELAVDLTQHPTPTGLVSVTPGQTWNFTAWFRDANPTVTSNFADGLEVTFTN